MNKEKTEYTTVKRGQKEEKKCDKNGIKAWSLGRNPEKERISNYDSCKEWHNLEKELESETDNQNPAVRYVVKSVLLYNCRTWGVSKDDQGKLSSFHRRQLKKVIGTQGSHKMFNNKL